MPKNNDFQSCSEADFRHAAQQAAGFVLERRLLRPWVACVLGSGLGGLADRVVHAQEIAYNDIPGFPPTHAAGHRGRLITGYLGGVPVVLMQGRSHRYEGRSPREVQFPVHVMQALGASLLITTNAAGGLNPRFKTGDLMVIDSHIDLLWPRRQWPAPEPETAPRKPSPYSADLIQKVLTIARSRDVILHRGCYLGTLGPTYETRSEYRLFRWAGADAVGMSTIPEVLAARDLGMKLLAISVITNVASTESATATSHADVVESGNRAAPGLLSIIEQLLEEISGQPD